MKREFSAGGVVYKKLSNQNSGKKVLWLVAKSKPSQIYPDDIWRLPKGWLDDKEKGKKPGPFASGLKKATIIKVKKAALKEVKEEGGVKAKIIKKITIDRYFYTNKDKEKIIKFVTYFLMVWDKDLKEGFGEETEKVEWLEFEKAKEKLTYSREKKILEKANRLLGTGTQSNLI